VILVTLVLMFFMGLRNALFVGIAIPLVHVYGIYATFSHWIFRQYDGTFRIDTGT
jgi:Cu/Ag efflux pump CusA